MAGRTMLLHTGVLALPLLLAVLLLAATALAAVVAAAPVIRQTTPVPNETFGIGTQEPTEVPTPLPLRTTVTLPVAEPDTNPNGVPPVGTIAGPDPAREDEAFLKPALPDPDEPDGVRTKTTFDRSREDDGSPSWEETEKFPVEELPSPADDAIDEPEFSPGEEIDGFTEEIQQADPALSGVTVDGDAVVLSFSRKARLFGFIETGYTDVVRVSPGGDLDVESPWWLGFAVTDDRKTPADYATMFENFDQKANQFFNILSTAMKTKKEMNSSVVSNIV